MVVDRKSRNALALLYLASGPLPNAAKSRAVPTLFATENTTKTNSEEKKFRNLNFLPTTKKTTGYSFELFLSIYSYKMFFLIFKTSVVSNNRFAK